jgi:hypothetical protein
LDLAPELIALVRVGVQSGIQPNGGCLTGGVAQWGDYRGAVGRRFDVGNVLVF